MGKAEIQENNGITLECLEFVLFCVENLAERVGRSPVEIYDLLNKNSGLLESYIIPCFEPLHTQGKDYIIDDLLSAMKMKGILI